MLQDDSLNEDLVLDQSIKQVQNNVTEPTQKYQQVTVYSDELIHFSDLTYIWQFNKTYLIFEHNNNLYLLDQHAGMERFMYEKILKTFSSMTNESYELLVPINIELSSSEIILLENKINALR